MVLALLVVGRAAAQFEDAGIHVDTLHASTVDVPVQDVATVFVPGKHGPAAAFEVTFAEAMPEKARTAFDLATAIWSVHLASDVPIRVDVRWEEMAPRVLASSGPRLIAVGAEASGVQPVVRPFTLYPAALLDNLLGENLSGDAADLVVTFNSTFDSWYYGRDGQPLIGMTDLASVALHELAHGLGFFGSASVTDGDEENGRECGTPAGLGCWGIRSLPTIYDRFVYDADGRRVLTPGLYPNPSPALGDVLQSQFLYFDGPSARVGNQDVAIRLYAPATFKAGASYSHLDEGAYPHDTPSALMTPFLGRNEVIRSPGPAACAVLEDLGWQPGPACLDLLARVDMGLQGHATSSRVTLRWQAGQDARRYEVEHEAPDGRFVSVAELAAPGASSPVAEVPDLDPGTHRFRVKQYGPEGAVTFSEVADVLVPLTSGLRAAGPYPNPAFRETRLDLLAAETQRVRVRVFDVLGRQRAVLLDDVVQGQTAFTIWIPVHEWQQGVYFVEIQGKTFRETRALIR